jgi:hypothetical protein
MLWKRTHGIPALDYLIFSLHFHISRNYEAKVFIQNISLQRIYILNIYRVKFSAFINDNNSIGCVSLKSLITSNILRAVEPSVG